MLIKNIKDVPAVPVNMEGAKQVQVRVIYGPKDNAPTFAMRVFELAPGGHTPYHEHNFEHEVLILDGRIAVVTPDGPRPLKIHDTLLVPANETHQFKNLSDTQPASFMCLVPISYQK
jgi:quercetin dioxygenase-like cupin family protein